MSKKYDHLNERVGKLEKKIFDLTGTVRYIDPHKCFVCGQPADMGWGNALGPQRGYCRKHMPQTATETAGECSCPSTTLYPRDGMANEPISIDVDCPVCGKSTWQTKTPDLPLHVRVAKALKKRVFYDHVAEIWKDADTIKPILSYDTDLVAAMGALEEYCQQKNADVDISILRRTEIIYFCKIGFRGELALIDRGIVRKSDSLPQAICEAIVAHAEGK